MKNFSKRLKTLRNDKKVTQEEIAKRLNIQRATYSGYERGIIMPPYEKINALAQYFNVSVEYLMGEEKPKENPTDIMKELSKIISELQNDESNVTFHNIFMDETSREILKSNLEAAIKTVDVVMKGRK